MDGELIMDRPAKKSNELIKRRKRKNMIKKSILTLSFLTIVLVTLCFKLPFFAVSSIVVQNNNYIGSEAIIQLSGISNGNNIFSVDTRKAEKSIETSSYIEKAVINKKLPNTVFINVKEREAVLYFTVENKNIIMDKEGTILEEKDATENLGIVKVEGIKAKNIQLGKVIDTGDERVKKILIDFAGLIKRNTSSIKFDYIDLKNLSDIRIYSSQMYFKIGDSYNIEDKLNKAINIASKDDIKGKKGYIDVSFEGNPVLHID
jgi:cell division protein FtsQ